MRLVAVMLAVAVCIAPLAAQTTAALTGTVFEDGVALAGATVTVTSPALQGERTTTTSDSGAFHFASLPPGEYTVRTGDLTRTVTLALSQTTRADFVRMTAIVAAQLDPSVTSKPVATTFPLESIERLPVQRNQNATAQLAPGVTPNTLSNGQLAISGAPGYDNLVIVNGVVVNENTRGQMRPMYVEDAIDETTVLTGAISAEFGRFTGGVVNTITKQGSNDLGITFRDSLGNPRWSAVSPANESREDNLNHVFEATVGGPLMRDRVWFFTAARWAKNDTARQTLAIPAGPGSVASPQLSYSESNDQKRYEGKITARPVANHTATLTYFGIDTTTENSRFSNNIYDAASLTSRDEPETLGVLRYEAVLTRDLLIEGQVSRRTMSLSSGATTRDLVAGTVLLDRANSNARFNSPSLCAICESEDRNNTDAQLKARWFVDAFGTHDVSAGVDRFTENHLLEDRQSGSDFSLFVTRAQWKDGAIYPVITPTTANGGGTFIRWNPVLTGARENELRTDSAFVSDTWDRARLSVTAGLRYDRNHAEDADGTLTANDRKVSPRLALQFDPAGNGRHRINASYGVYASRVADSIASSNQIAGRAASIDFAYRGPSINAGALNVPMDQVIAQVFAYFNATQGGTDNRTAQNLRANGTREIPGYTTYFDGTLATPSVRELTLGYGMQFPHGLVRADLVARDWRDFYTLSVTRDTRRTTTPLGIPVDLALVRNTNEIERTYRGVHLQARWTASPFDLGAFYTWSKLRGNDEGETANGPIANVAPSIYYPEFLDYERNNPIGYLRGDQRHRVRAWAGYTLGRFDVSLLQTYDSGIAYSLSSAINVTRYTGAPENPGYNAIPAGRYFFTDRGALRADDVTSTNLALRYTHPIGAASLFAHADVLNVFDEGALADPQRIGTGISTAANSATLQPFDPRTTTPVEGVHYTYAANFGQALNNLAYQTPRTYRVSLGVKF